MLAASLLHCVAGAAAWLPPGLALLEPLSLGAVALCLPRIALRAALALRRGVSSSLLRARGLRLPAGRPALPPGGRMLPPAPDVSH